MKHAPVHFVALAALVCTAPIAINAAEATDAPPALSQTRNELAPPPADQGNGSNPPPPTPVYYLPPAALIGSYKGVVTVTEQLADGGAGVPLAVKTSAPVTAYFFNGVLRVLAAPGSQILAYVDEPNFASVKIQGVYDYYFAIARKFSDLGTFSFSGRKVQVTFKARTTHRDVFNHDQTLESTITVTFDLVRAGS